MHKYIIDNNHPAFHRVKKDKGATGMYELIQAGANTYYIDCPAKIGVYVTENNEVYLIDSGNDKDAAKKVLKILVAQNWKLQGIVNTHSHADHIGGNQFLQEKTGCHIISMNAENAFVRYPFLESSFLYGGYPCKELRNKFLLAAPSIPVEHSQISLPGGLTTIPLGGHSFDMIGIKTNDDVYFLADCLLSENTIKKYHISFLYDVAAFLETLDRAERLAGALFIPSHAEATKNIKPLVQINRDKVNEIITALLEICKQPLCFEEILKAVFDRYGLMMDCNQYVLVGSTVRSYLSYLHNKDAIQIQFSENRLLWSAAAN
jgi:glyoxylase-like metal-dependent hydrolase (beta-lactamase superfamily II)